MERPSVIVALALSPSLDVTYEVEELRPGSVTRPTRVTRVAGGKALNVARVARALGADVRAVAALGGHIGAWVHELLLADGIAVDVIRLRGQTRTCTAIVERDGDVSSTDLYEAPTPVEHDEWAAFRTAAIAAATTATWVAVSGSLPPGVAPGAVRALLADLREDGRRIAADSSGEGLRSLATVADLIKVNRHEAEELLGEPCPDAAAAAASLHRRHGCDVVVTDGVRGGAALIDGEPHELPAPTRTGRFSAGSGDAFLGALLAALDEGDAPAAALRRAADSAERNALVAGQGILG